MGMDDVFGAAMEKIFEGPAGSSITPFKLTFLRSSGHLGEYITSANFFED